MEDEKQPDPLQKPDIGEDAVDGGVTPTRQGQVLSGGMSGDADAVSDPELGGPAGPSVGGEGSIGGGGGIDDGSTHGGGTATPPRHEEVTGASRRGAGQ